MRTCASLILLSLVSLAGLAARADETEEKEKAEKLAAQKKVAAAAWEAVEAGPVATAETKNLLIWAPRSSEPKLKATGEMLEKYLALAGKTADLDLKDLPGKITVYLFPQRELVTTFARRVEKRRPTSGEVASFSGQDDRLHVAAAPTAGKVPVLAETRAGEQLAALLLARKAGKGTPVPDWLFAGFGRATTYRVSPKSALTLEDAKQAKKLAKTHKPSDLWSGSLEAEDVEVLQGSAADFLAYGPGSKYFLKLVDGFKLGEGAKSKSVGEALTAAGLSADKLDKAWQNWAKK